MSYWVIDRRRRVEDSGIATMAIFGDLSPGKRRFAKFLAVVAAIVVGGYLVYAMFNQTIEIRYRLTLDVEVEGEPSSGSGVVEISYPIISDQLQNLEGGSRYHGFLHGYAVTIDLGKRGLLFVTNSFAMHEAPTILFPSDRPFEPRIGETMDTLPFVAYGFPRDGPASIQIGRLRELRGRAGQVEIALKDLPLLIYFADIGDRYSAEIVDPRDIGATLGPGVKLLRARFEQTTEPVTAIPPSWPQWLVNDHADYADIGNHEMISKNETLYSRYFKGAN